ncbi:MAG TPA: efflux RND transporter periplasmic adaptor subunit [Elusimicrobiales bacterium]|nr:efflux RND transporter periplasmic adaptor subunit [Elusimicrobiales bacterium]
MKRTIIVIIAALAVAAGGAYLHRKNSARAGTGYSPAAASTQEISESVDTTGAVAPMNRVEIQPSAAGRIERILVEEGDRIKTGQVLALMSSSDRVAILDAARAMGDEQYNYWQDAYKPIKVVAPLDGTIILKNIVEGQTVGQSTVLFAMSDRLILIANVDESDVGKIRNGQRAVITLDAYPNEPVEGRVFQILDEGVNQSNVITYSVKIKPARTPSFFKSQMTANIKIEVASKRKALMIPSAAVTIGPSGDTSVVTELKDGKPVYAKITTGVDQGGMTEVVKGLEEGAGILVPGRTYKAQQASGTNPLMPSRPAGMRKAGRALH